MIMNATVIQAEPRSLLVWDSDTGNEVRVHFRNSNRFSPGEHVRIEFNGVMTHSIPPQITATSIQRISDPTPPKPNPSEMRAVILQRRRDSLLVRNLSNNRQTLVIYRHAHHFCPGQRITVHYDVMRMSNPVEVDATDIIPIC